jgi:CDGSH-type Zn-finger protein
MAGEPGGRQPRIVVTRDGPYQVTGAVPLAVQVITPNAEGLSWVWTEAQAFPTTPSYRLCRCGHSKRKPFCDNTHRTIDFDGEETASRETVAEQSDTFEGPTLDLDDAERLCAFARFCDPGGKIWSLIEGTDEPQVRDLVIREATHCPAGRLVLHEKSTGETLEPEFRQSIGVVEDPALGCSGPLWVRGGIAIESADGTTYEVRNRVTLCRCGVSGNKPFCDGSHASIKFQDGITPADPAA